MPQIPSSQDAEKQRREEEYIREAGEEAARVRKEDQERRLRNIKVNEEVQARLDKAEPLGPRPVIPVMGQDLGGGMAERRIVPDINDPIRDAPEVGTSVWTADLALPAAPEGPGLMGMGSGGPLVKGSPKLSEGQVVDLQEWYAEKEAGRQSAEARSRLMQGADPEVAAKALDLAGRTGRSRLEVQQDVPGFSAIDMADRIDRLRASAPKLRTWLDETPDNFDVAHDDTDSLAWWEQAGTPTFEEFGAAVKVGTVDRTREQFFGAIEMGTGIARMFEWVPGVKPLLDAGDAEARKQRIMAAIDAVGSMPEGDTDIEKGLYGAGASAPSSMVSTLISIVTKSPVSGPATLGAMTAGGAYGEAEDAGKPFADRLRYAATQGAIETGTELIPMKFLLGDLSKETPFAKTFFRQIVAEGLSEQAATFLQDASTWLELNPEKTIGEFFAERPSAAIQTAVASTLMAGVQTTIAKGADEGLKKVSEGYAQKRSEDIANMMRAMGEGAAASKLLKRLPEKYREVVGVITKDGPKESVRIDAEGINALAQEIGVSVEQLESAFHVAPGSVQAAVDTGDDVIVPSGNYAAVIQTAKKDIGVSGEVIHQKLAPHVKFKDTDLTPAQFEAFRDEMAKAGEQAEAGTAFADVEDRLRNTITEQVRALNVWDEDVIGTYAEERAAKVITLARRMSQATGEQVDPEQLYKDEFAPIVLGGKWTELGEQDAGALAQSGDREAIEVDDATVQRASETLTEYEFAIWKAAALEGRSNKNIADNEDIEALRQKQFMTRSPADAMPAATSVATVLSKARRLGLPVDKAQKGRPDTIKDEVTRLVKMGLSSKQIHERLGRPPELRNSTNAQVSKIKRAMREEEALAQSGNRAEFSAQTATGERFTTLFEGARLDSLLHEGAHEYLDLLYRLSQKEGANPFIVSHYAAILNWHGLHPEWSNMYDPATGNITEEGRKLHETFAEAYALYFMMGKAPNTAMRSVFETIRQRMLSIYKVVRKGLRQVIYTEASYRYTSAKVAAKEKEVGRRLKDEELIEFVLPHEIRQIFDRSLAVDEAINAVHARLAKDGQAMAEAMADRLDPEGKWKPERKAKFLARMMEKYQQALDLASAEAHARQIEEFMRSKRSWWNDEWRQVQREVQPEVDERPEQRLYAWITGVGWRDTRADQAEAALSEAEDMNALPQTQFDLKTPEDRAAWFAAETVSDVIPGETADSRQYGFAVGDTGVVMSIAMGLDGAAMVEWTFLDRLSKRDEAAAPYSKGEEDLSVSQIKALLVRVVAVLEADMAQFERDAYVFTPASDAHAKIYSRLFKVMGGTTYNVTEFDTDVILVHPEARLPASGSIIPAPQNEGRAIEWDDGRDAEARADAFYEKVRGLARSAGLAQSGQSGTSPDGDGGRSLAQELGPSRKLDAMGFYSALREAVANSKQAKASAEQWKATLKQTPGVKQEEIEWTGLFDWLDSLDTDSVPKADVVNYLANNGVKVEEVDNTLKVATPFYIVETTDENGDPEWQVHDRDNGDIVGYFDEPADAEEVRDRANVSLVGTTESGDFASFTLPGGEDYTELLLTLPDVKGPATHWDEPNVVAHVRFKTRRGADGSRVLAIEEVQSDWHQKGREQGYAAGPASEEEIRAADDARMAAQVAYARATTALREAVAAEPEAQLVTASQPLVNVARAVATGAVRVNDPSNIVQALQEFDRTKLELNETTQRYTIATNGGEGIPNAPFKNNGWAALVLKRMIRYAAEHGYDSVAWIPGNVKNGDVIEDARATEVYLIRQGDDSEIVQYLDSDGVRLVAPVEMGADNVLGKKIAAQLRAEPENSDEFGRRVRKLKGDFLVHRNPGWEFYDQIVVNEANKLGKKYGAQVAPSAIPVQPAGSRRSAPAESIQFHSLPLTPELKAAAMEGMPLFQTGTRRGTTTPPADLPPMRLNLQAVKEQYGEQALREIPPDVAAFSAKGNDVEAFVDIARNVRKSLKQAKPKSLWKFLSTQRRIGSGNDRISYSGIRDPDGEILAIIDKKGEARGLIADPKNDGKKSRSYDIEQAAMAAWEEGYFTSESPPTPAEFMDALRNDVSGTNKVYSRNDQATLADIDNANQWAEWFDLNGVDISADVATLREQLALALTGQGENAISPDEAAPFFKMKDGAELLQKLKEGTKRNQIIREETRRRMIATHGDIFNDGTLMKEAEAFARNEIQFRQFEIELAALSQAAGKQSESKLAKQHAIEALRTKQVREVLNYNQWLILERRWAAKALEAAQKGDDAKAAEYARYRLIQSHMYTEGRKLAEEIEKDRKHLIGYGAKSKQARLYAAGKDYADQMNGLLSDYQLRPESRKGEQKRIARGVWIQQQMAGIDPYAAYADPTKTAQEQQVAAAEALERSQVLAKLAEGTEARGFKSLTVEELQTVRAEADMIWKLATLKDRLIKEGERRRLTLAGEDIAAEIEANQPNEKPPEPIETDTGGEKVKRSVQMYFARHRTMQSLARQFAGGKDGGVFWRYIVRPLNEAFSKLSTLRKQMGEDVVDLFGAYTKAEQERLYRDRRHFKGINRSLTTQARLAIALNWGNEKNRRRIMDAYGWDAQQVQEVLDSLDKRDWDFVQKTWDYLDTWFPEANRVHEAVHGAPMDKEAPLEIATRFGVYRGGYYPIRFDPRLSSKSGQRAVVADSKAQTGQVGTRTKPGSTIKRVEGKVTLPLRLSVFDVVTSHLDEVARSIATEEVLFDAGRIIKQKSVEDAIVTRHGREIYNTLVAQLVTAKFGMEGTGGLLAHLRNGATVVGLSWKVATASLQMLGVSNSVVRVGSPWIAMGYGRMGKDAASLQSSANWIMERSEFMRHRRQQQSPEQSALMDAVKTKWTPDFVARFIPRQLRAAHNMMVRNGFALMANVQFYSVDMPTWYGAYFKAQAEGRTEADAVALADQAVIDAQGGGELHQLAAMQSGAGTKYAALLRILTNFMSYLLTTYNLGVQKVRNARTAGQIVALSFDLVLLAAVPVAGKMLLDAITKGVGEDDEPEEWMERYLREQVAFLFGPLVGISQFAGSARGEDSYGYKGPAGLAIFNELNALGTAVAEGKFIDDEGGLDKAFWRPANRALGMVLHFPASQVDATIRGSQAYFNGETDNPAAIFFGPPPAN